MSELVPQAVRDLYAFYSERYPEARFGDVDVSFLESAVESIDEAAAAVTAAQQAVTEARANFATVERDLTQKAGRVLSFLTIFLEGNPEQLAALEAIGAAMPGAARRKARASSEGAASGEPRRRRSRKPTEADLSADRVMEAALEKAGLTGDLTAEWDPTETEESAPAASAKAV